MINGGGGLTEADCHVTVFHTHTHTLAADGSVKCHPLGLPAWPHVVPAMHFCYATQFNDGRGGRAPYSEGN